MEPTPSPTEPIDHEAMDNKEMVRYKFERVWGHGDLTMVDRFTAPNFVGHDPEFDIKGPEGLKQYMLDFRHAFPDVVFDLEDVVAEDDRVLLRWKFDATHLGDFRGMRASGKKVKGIQGMIIMKTHEGRVTESWISVDRLGLVIQLGYIPQALALPTPT